MVEGSQDAERQTTDPRHEKDEPPAPVVSVAAGMTEPPGLPNMIEAVMTMVTEDGRNGRPTRSLTLSRTI